MDLKDPNRPRFTLQELRDVLHERNELKSRVFLLQEELLYYKRCVGSHCWYCCLCLLHCATPGEAQNREKTEVGSQN